MTTSPHTPLSVTIPPFPTTVVATTIIQLSPRLALDFAEALEAQNLADLLRENRVFECKVLKDPTLNGFLLDQALVGQLSPDAVYWLQEHHCPRFSGCRVSLYEEGVMDDLLQDYQGSRWDDQGYTVIAASALEISIALELRDCPTMLQLELLGVGSIEKERCG